MDGWTRPEEERVPSRLDAVVALVRDVQISAMHFDICGSLELTVATSLAPDGVAPSEVSSEHNDAVVEHVAHVERIPGHRQRR